jgi:hypothetical protein
MTTFTLVSSFFSLFQNILFAEAEFLDVIGTKVLRVCNGLHLVCNVNSVYEILSLRTLNITPRNLNDIVHPYDSSSGHAKGFSLYRSRIHESTVC